MAAAFDELDLPDLEKHLFTTLYLDVSIPALEAHTRFGLKVAPSEHQQIFDSVDKLVKGLFKELDVVSLGGLECQRDYLGLRDRAARSFQEWQDIVDEWKGSLLTRLEDLGKELVELRKNDHHMRQILDEKEATIAELNHEKRKLKRDLRNARRSIGDKVTVTPGGSSVMGFFAKTFSNKMSQESLTDGRSSIADTVKAGISSVPFLRKLSSQDVGVTGILPGEVGDVLQDTGGLSEEEGSPASPASLRSHSMEMSDAAVQADAKGVAVSHVGIQCYLRSYDFNSAILTHRRSIG